MYKNKITNEHEVRYCNLHTEVNEYHCKREIHCNGKQQTRNITYFLFYGRMATVVGS